MKCNLLLAAGAGVDAARWPRLETCLPKARGSTATRAPHGLWIRGFRTRPETRASASTQMRRGGGNSTS